MKKLAEWFIKKAFPVIAKLLIIYSEEIVRFLVKGIYNYISDREQKKAKENLFAANEKIKEAKIIKVFYLKPVFLTRRG